MSLRRTLHPRGARLLQQGKYREAETALRTAIARAERRLGPDHAELVEPLNDLARCYQHLARFVDAGMLYQRALRIAEGGHGRGHLEVATIYHNLGALEYAAGNWLRGEPFLRKAARLRKRALGPRHPLVAIDLSALGALLDRQGRHDEAAPLHARALSILEHGCAPDDPFLADVLGNMAVGQRARGRSAQAEALFRRALEVRQSALGPGHPQVALEWSRLGAVLASRRNGFHEAVPILHRALRVLRARFGPGHPHVAACLEAYAHVLQRLRRSQAARAAANAASRIRGRIEAVNSEGVALTGTINPDLAGFDLMVRRSAIHRLGVFAGERIPARRRVIEYTGERITAAEGARRWDPARSYLFDLTRNCQLDGAIGGSGAEYINHSCEPNLKGRLVSGHILYFSTREIAEGEELTVDYQYAYNTDRIPCSCGASACRGAMNLSRREAQARRARRRRRV